MTLEENVEFKKLTLMIVWLMICRELEVLKVQSRSSNNGKLNLNHLRIFEVKILDAGKKLWKGKGCIKMKYFVDVFKYLLKEIEDRYDFFCYNIFY